MINLYGIKGLAIKTFRVTCRDTSCVNKFLQEYDGNIVGIDVVPITPASTDYVIVFKEREDD